MSSVKKLGESIVLCATLVMAGVTSASANDDSWTAGLANQRGVHVLDRERPEFDAVGLRAGSFIVYPELELGLSYDDNVFATQNNTDSSAIYSVTPSVTVESDFGRHGLDFSAYSDSDFYSDESSEDNTEWGVGTGGYYDVSQSTQIAGRASYDSLTEARTSTDRVAGGSEPTEYDLLKGALQLNQRFNRFTASVGVEYWQYDYDDTPAIGGGTIDQDFRDHDRLNFPVRLAYDVSPDTGIFIRGAYNMRDYDQQPPVTAVSRDSDGYDVGVGAFFDITNLVRGEVWAGYLSQEYDNPAFQDVDGLDFALQADWFATELTTVSGSIGRSVEESTSAGSSGHLDTNYQIGIAHELQRNIILTADSSYLDVEFEGIARDDETISAGVGVQYLVNAMQSWRSAMTTPTAIPLMLAKTMTRALWACHSS